MTNSIRVATNGGQLYAEDGCADWVPCEMKGISLPSEIELLSEFGVQLQFHSETPSCHCIYMCIQWYHVTF